MNYCPSLSICHLEIYAGYERIIIIGWPLCHISVATNRMYSIAPSTFARSSSCRFLQIDVYKLADVKKTMRVTYGLVRQPLESLRRPKRLVLFASLIKPPIYLI